MIIAHRTIYKGRSASKNPVTLIDPNITTVSYNPFRDFKIVSNYDLQHNKSHTQDPLNIKQILRSKRTHQREFIRTKFEYQTAAVLLLYSLYHWTQLIILSQLSQSNPINLKIDSLY